MPVSEVPTEVVYLGPEPLSPHSMLQDPPKSLHPKSQPFYRGYKSNLPTSRTYVVLIS